MQDEAIYMHDCPECIFLGSYTVPDGLGYAGKYDLYYCEQGDVQTVLARYGNADHQYDSGVPLGRDIVNTCPWHPVFEVYRRAKMHGMKIGSIV